MCNIYVIIYVSDTILSFQCERWTLTLKKTEENISWKIRNNKKIFNIDFNEYATCFPNNCQHQKIGNPHGYFKPKIYRYKTVSRAIVLNAVYCLFIGMSFFYIYFHFGNASSYLNSSSGQTVIVVHLQIITNLSPLSLYCTF